MVRACLSKCQGFFHPPTWIDRYNHQLTNIIFSRGSITNLVMSPPRREGFKIIFLLPPGHDWIVFSFLMRWAWGWGLGLGDWGWGWELVPAIIFSRDLELDTCKEVTSNDLLPFSRVGRSFERRVKVNESQ